MLFKLWLDDERKMPEGYDYWAHNYKEAVDAINTQISPTLHSLFISFDHDLGEGKSGYDFAKWLLENGYMGQFTVHSMNVVGRKNIEQLLTHYMWEEVDPRWYIKGDK
jgi:predicted AlkP superfamily phosphohydrolase/phosphomutase